MENSRGKGRTRNFATVVYPESAPDNWLDIIRDSHINCLISPLHDKDINPSGEAKKAHYHVLVLFDTVKSVEQFKEFASSFGGVGTEKINTVRGYARYLCHLDNPEKARYNENDVICIGSCDYFELISLPSDKYQVIREIINFCESGDITNFADVFRYAADNEETWFRCLCDNGAYVVKEYLKSRSYGQKKNLLTK